MNKTELIAIAAQNAGMTKKDAERCLNAALDAMTAALKEMAQSGDVILFKASHGMHLQLALEQFLK